jgi:site-specific recombinase XerD
MKHRRPRVVLEEIDAELLVRYIQSRTAFKAKATVAGKMSIMRNLGEFLVREGIWRSNPLRWMKGPKLDPRARVPRRIGRKALDELWKTAATNRKGYHRSLWLAVMGLLYGTGLRRGELVRLNVGDWLADEGVLRIDGRKTGQERRVPLPELAWRCLEAYLPIRHNRLEELAIYDQQALFVNQDGGRLSATGVSGGIRRIGERAGLGRITLHQFRHSCASDLLEDGVRIPEVQRVLGHQTVTTTVRYLHVADPQRHAAVALHPINQMLSVAEVA